MPPARPYMKSTASSVFLSVLIAQLAACSIAPTTKVNNTAASSASEFVGCWYGEDFQPVFRQSASWLMNRQQDGTFHIDFWSWSSSGSLKKQTERGRWSLNKNIYTTITTEINGGVLQENYIDDYEIRSFDGMEMVYFHSKAKITFKSKKVSCNYSPPSPRKLDSPA